MLPLIRLTTQSLSGECFCLSPREDSYSAQLSKTSVLSIFEICTPLSAVGGKTGDSILIVGPARPKPTRQTSHRIIMPAHAQSSHVRHEKKILHKPHTLHEFALKSNGRKCTRVGKLDLTPIKQIIMESHQFNNQRLPFHRGTLSTSGNTSSIHANHVLQAICAARINSCNSLPSCV